MNQNEEQKTEEVSINTPEVPQTVDNKGSNPEDVYAAMFSAYLPRFKLMLGKMSNKMLRRLITALIEVPLNEKEYKPNKFEHDAFLIGDQLLQAKMFMILKTLSEQQTGEQNDKEKK